MTSQALSFGAAAALYDSIRPGYPRASVDWALGDRPLRVLDLGAGTGLLTRTLLSAGHEVVCVEPDDQMRAVLAAAHPSATALAGAAERVPLPDASVDAVTCGQAYHWFDPGTALPEIRRVLRPGGVFAPLWNVRDERVDWIAELSRIVGSEGAGSSRPPERGADFRHHPGLPERWIYGDVRPWFTEPECTVVAHRVTMDGAGLLRLVRSRSYYLTAAPQQQARLDADVRRLVAEHPQLAGRDAFDMEYLTCAFRMRPA